MSRPERIPERIPLSSIKAPFFFDDAETDKKRVLSLTQESPK